MCVLLLSGRHTNFYTRPVMRAQVVRNASIFCAGIPNLMLRLLGRPVPCERGAPPATPQVACARASGPVAEGSCSRPVGGAAPRRIVIVLYYICIVLQGGPIPLAASSAAGRARTAATSARSSGTST